MKHEQLRSGYEFSLEINIIAQLSNNLMLLAVTHGLTMPQFSVLTSFARIHSEAKPGRLARAFQVTNGAMTSTLQRLVEEKLVSVDPHPDSGRPTLVRMTALGRPYRDDAIAHTFADIEIFSSYFSLADVQALLPSLLRVREYLDPQRDQGR